jgi:phosphoglycerol transferase
MSASLAPVSDPPHVPLRVVYGGDPQCTVARKAVLALCQYGFAAGLSIVILSVVMRLWQADLSVPFRNEGDALLTQLWAKTLVDHGWYLHNPDIGAPGRLDFNDFPLADSWHFIIMKALACLLRKPAAVVNFYFLLCFPLAAVSALFFLRQLGISYGCALVSAELFTFLPYHFFRGTFHLMLASYYLVPLAVLVAVWIYRGEPQWPAKRWIAAILISGLLSSAGVYYAFFTAYFLSLAGLAAAWLRRQARHPFRSIALIAIITTGLCANYLPTVLYQRQHGANPAVIARSPEEAEIFGMKLVPLLLPVQGHRVGALADVTRQYQQPPRYSLLHNENLYGPLGMVGACGFFILLGRMLLGRSPAPGSTTIDQLAALNVFAVLLGTMGGLGAVVALLGFPWIRAYNRISVFIALFSLTAVALVLDRLLCPNGVSRSKRLFRCASLGVLFVLGVLDQTTEQFVPNYAGLAADKEQIHQFVDAIEKTLPPQSMIFQLPYTPFLEYVPQVKMCHFDHCRPYLVSKTLRWSYGAMPGRQADLFQKGAAALPAGEMVKRLSIAGFRGIWLDRNGYIDRAGNLTAELGRLLQVAPMESRCGRWVFLDMTNFNCNFRKCFTDQNDRAQISITNPER